MNRVVLVSYKDNTYYYNLMQDEAPVNYNVMLSKGIWLYKIPLEQLTKAIRTMRENGDDIAVFESDNANKPKFFVATRNSKAV